MSVQAVKRNKKVLEQKEATIAGNSNDWHKDSDGQSGRLKFYLEDALEGIRREIIKEGKL